MPTLSLSDLAADALLTEGETADYLRIRPGALKGLRLRGRGPAAIYVGRAVRYPAEAVRSFVAGEDRRRSAAWPLTPP